jgi:hypothetical protein
MMSANTAMADEMERVKKARDEALTMSSAVNGKLHTLQV